MDKITSKIRQLNNWYVIAIISIVFTLCAVAYFRASAGMSGNIGIEQALEFLLKHPKEYSICLSCGSIAKITVYIMTIITAVSAIELILSFMDRGFYDEEEYPQDRRVIECIIKSVISIVGWYFHSKIIVNFWILLILAFLILGFIWLICNNI